MALKLAEGESFIDGRSPKKAKELLDKAEKAGLDKSTVRTTSGGYIVPSKLVGKGEASQSGDEQADEPTGVSEAGKASDEAAALKAEGANADDQKDATGDGDTEGDQTSDEQYDPSKHNVDEVNEYLASADADERERVLAAERDGKARSTILPDTEGDK